MPASPSITGHRLFRLWILGSLLLMAVVVASVDQCEFAKTPEGWCKRELAVKDHIGFLLFALSPAAILFVLGLAVHRVVRAVTRRP